MFRGVWFMKKSSNGNIFCVTGPLWGALVDSQSFCWLDIVTGHFDFKCKGIWNSHQYIQKLSLSLESFRTFRILTGLCPEICVNKNPWFHSQRPVTWSFLCFLECEPEQMLEQTVEMSVICDAMAPKVTWLLCVSTSLCVALPLENERTWKFVFRSFQLSWRMAI